MDKKIQGGQIVLGESVSSIASDLFRNKSYLEVTSIVLSNSTPLMIGALIEVFTETVAAFEMITDSKADNTF